MKAYMGYIIISTPGQSVCKHMVIGSSLDTTIVVWKLIPFPANISIFAHPIMLGLNREGFCSQLFAFNHIIAVAEKFCVNTSRGG